MLACHHRHPRMRRPRRRSRASIPGASER
jgi:hypothetical protein